MKNTLYLLFFSFLLAGCSFQSKQIILNTNTDTKMASKETVSPASDTAEYSPVDPIEIFLVQLTKDVNISFDNPAKADIFWNEGETSSTLKTYFGDSFLIKESNSTIEKEKIVSDYLIKNGFVAMKFNGSIGDDSRKMGYRKDNLICKTDFSIYPEETSTHLVVYCSDATKGTLRK